MELKYVIAVAAVPIVLLLTGPQAQAYWGYEFRFGNGDWTRDGLRGGGPGYHAGVVDAQSDFQSNSAFTPYPSYC